jgi:hypothetical protein
MRPHQRFALARLALLATQGVAQAAAPGFTLTAAPDAMTVRAGEKAVVTLTLKNTGAAETVIERPDGEAVPRHFAVRIRDEDGNTPRLTDIGEVLVAGKSEVNGQVHLVVGSRRTMRLAPGETYSARCDIAELYRLAPRHHYVLSFAWNATMVTLPAPLRSNLVTISVR